MTQQQIPQLTLAEKLTSLPTDRHVFIKSYPSRHGTYTYYRAFWHEQVEGQNKKFSLTLGRDDEQGAIAAYIQQLESKEPPITIHDEQGTQLLIDADMAHFFKPPPPYKKIYVLGGKRYVQEFSVLDSILDHQGRYVSLETYLYEIMREVQVSYTRQVVQKVPGTDYTLANLKVIEKAEKRSA